MLTRISRGLAAATLLSLCAATLSAQGRIGVDTTHFDRSTRPQDDFYQFANGGWLAHLEIPADKSSYGSFTALRDKSDEAILAIVHDATASGVTQASAGNQKIANFYRAFMDTARIERLGMSPIQPELDRIAALSSTTQLPAEFAHLRRVGVGLPFGGFVNQDGKAADRYAVYLSQGRLGMPDRDYYLRDDARFTETRAKYQAYIAQLMTLAHQPNPDSAAAHILAFETDLAQAQWSRVRNRNRDSTYNKMSVAALQQHAPGFDWAAFLHAGDMDVDSVIIIQPSYFEAFAGIAAKMPLDAWKTYLTYRVVADAAPLLSSPFVAADFEFNDKTLGGQQQPRARDKQAVSALQGALGELVGQEYVKRDFSARTKARMLELVHNLQKSFAVGIDSLEWMSPATKAAAHEKLAKFTIKIGYPDKWRDYSALDVRPDDAVGNAMRSSEFEYERAVSRLGKPIDRTVWGMTPQTVNAYYNPVMNEIVFPAAIIQPPFYYADADDAVNYGGIGAVIGHEMSHAFDDQGRKSDGDGNLRDWWTPEDAAAFTKRAEALAAQYDTYSPVEGMHVNGHQTLGENIGDLSGLAIAYRAYHMSLKGKEAPVIGGLTGDQRFFLGFAQIWANLSREEALRRQVLSDAHAPAMFRGRGPLVNFQPFYDAWGLKQGDKMWKPASERIKIW